MLEIGMLWTLATALAAPPRLVTDPGLAEARAGRTAWGTATDDEGLPIGWAARTVRQPPDEVWAALLAYDAYTAFMPYVVASSLDRVEPPVYTCTMELLTKGLRTRYTVRNEWHAAEGWLGFEMLPSGFGPLQSASGYWVVEPEGEGSLVTYAIHADPAWWVPGWARERAAVRGLPVVLDSLARWLDRPRG